MSNIIFSDVPTGHWAERCIYFLEDRGIVNGVGGDRFNPAGTISIAEFCAMAVRAADIPPFYGNSWDKDKLGDYWAKKYIDYVRDERRVLVYPKGKTPSENLTEPIQRQFAFNIMWHIAAADKHRTHPYDGRVYTARINEKFVFSDRGDVLSDVRESVFQLVENGLLSGRGNGTSTPVLAPFDNLSRAEACVLIARCIVPEQGIEEFWKADYIVTASPTLNIRKDSSASSEKVGKFWLNNRIKIFLPKKPIPDGTNSWIKVYYGFGKEGWVAEEFLKENDNYIVTAKTAYIMSEPSASSAQRGTFKLNDKVRIVLPKQMLYNKVEHRFWIKVYYDGGGNEGWVAREHLDFALGAQRKAIDESILSNIEKDVSLGLSAQRKSTMLDIGRAMLNEGYEVAFVAGLLANVKEEGSVGLFEDSNYSDPLKKPDYLTYMEQYYDYKNKYSNKNIYPGMSLSKIYSLLLELEPNEWKAPNPDGRRRGFALGSVQWTFDRTKALVEVYMEVAGTSDTITHEQALKAELMMILQEFNGEYRSVYTKWEASNSSNLASSDAAYNAAYTICVDYEKPKDRSIKGVERGEAARTIYNIMMA